MMSLRGSSTSSCASPVADLYTMLTRSLGATDPSFAISRPPNSYCVPSSLFPVERLELGRGERRPAGLRAQPREVQAPQKPGAARGNGEHLLLDERRRRRKFSARGELARLLHGLVEPVRDRGGRRRLPAAGQFVRAPLP